MIEFCIGSSDDYVAITVFPHIVSEETILFEFGNPNVTVHKCAKTIQGQKLYEEIQYLMS